MPLTQGLFALVDAIDAPRVLRFKWHAHLEGNTYYARRQETYGVPQLTKRGKWRRRQRTVLLHRFICGLGHHDPRMPDHRNGEGLDCTRANLRLATGSQNQRNRRRARSLCNHSRYKGVTLVRVDRRLKGKRPSHAKPWQVCCARLYIGRFATELEAAQAYNRAAAALYGPWARLNEVPEPVTVSAASGRRAA